MPFVIWLTTAADGFVMHYKLQRQAGRENCWYLYQETGLRSQKQLLKSQASSLKTHASQLTPLQFCWGLFLVLIMGSALPILI